MSKTLSVVIPSYSCGMEQWNAIVNAADHYRPICDELIIVEDAGSEFYGISVADTMIVHSKNQGFTKTVNDGWRVARGDYVAIVNSDTFIEDGDIRGLCVEDTVTHPRVMGDTDQFGAFFVVPKTLTEKYGYLDEQFIMYYSDDDYVLRTELDINNISWVTVRHAYGFTTNSNPEYYKRIGEEDRKRFEEKWQK